MTGKEARSVMNCLIAHYACNVSVEMGVGN